MRAQGLEIFGRRRALGGEAGEDGDDIVVACDDPGVEVWVPMNRIVGTETMVERIGIGEDFGIEEMVKAQRSFACLIRNW